MKSLMDNVVNIFVSRSAAWCKIFNCIHPGLYNQPQGVAIFDRIFLNCDVFSKLPTDVSDCTLSSLFMLPVTWVSFSSMSGWKIDIELSCLSFSLADAVAFYYNIFKFSNFQQGVVKYVWKTVLHRQLSHYKLCLSFFLFSPLFFSSLFLILHPFTSHLYRETIWLLNFEYKTYQVTLQTGWPSNI